MSRRHFLKAGGALLVAIPLVPLVPLIPLTGAAGAVGAETPAAGAGAGLPKRADPKSLDAWLAIHEDNTATVFIGKVELGQGNSTTLLQIAADELDLDLAQMSAARIDTAHSQNQGATVSSSSIQTAGPPLRAAAAQAREALLQRASVQLGLPVASLTVEGGIVRGGGRQVSYGQLIGKGRFELAVTDKVSLKPASARRLVGQRVARRDIPAKVNGTYEFVQHVRVPGMLHARVVRPRGQGAYGTIPRVVSVDATALAAIPGARVLRQRDFLVVVAPRQWDAVRAADALKVQWDMPARLVGDGQLHQRLRSAPTTDRVMVNEGDAVAALAAAETVVAGRFDGPYQAHGSFAPSCAVAQVDDGQWLVHCSTQDVFALRERIASVLEVDTARVQVRYVEGSGCFGHNGADDAAIAAALASRLAGAPVRLQFTRADELGWDNMGPAHVGEMRLCAGRDGRIAGYEYHGWHHGWMIEETAEQMALGREARELAVGPGSLYVNRFDAGGMYRIPNWRLVNHAVSGLSGYLKGANLRAPMDLQYSFASEQLVDELALKLDIDPVEFRRRNVVNARWGGTLEAVARSSGWQPRTAAPVRTGPRLAGRGVALGTHRASMAAAVAEVAVDRASGEVRVLHVHVAMDCGLAINPAVVESQISGMAIQATSRMLCEEVRFDERQVTSLDWVSYPVLRFAAHPKVTAIVVPQPDEPSLGAGEEAIPAVGAAIANAFFDATGVRMHVYPLTPERVRRALA